MKFLAGLAVSLAVCMGLGWGVYRYAQAQAEQSVPPVEKRPLAVEVMRLTNRTVEERADLVGSLQAGAEVQILSRISGYIDEIPVDVGDAVEKGQVAVQLDDREQREAISAAKAALEVAEAELESQKAQVAQARRVVKRHEKLHESGAGTEQQLEQAQSQLDIATAQQQVKQAQVNRAKSDLEQGQLVLQDTEIVAPMAGYVAERFVDEGDLAKPDVPLLRIVAIETIRMVVHVTESDYTRVKIGQKATVRVDAFPDRRFGGTVVRKAPALNPNTRTAAVRIEVPNPDESLKPGMHARVTLVFDRREDADVLPVAAVVEHQEQPAVFVVEGDPPQAQLQPVQTGFNDGEIVEVLEGITSEDRVVTLGSGLVESGQTVNPTEVPWPEIEAPDDYRPEESPRSFETAIPSG